MFLKFFILLFGFFVSHLVEFHFTTDNGKVVPKWKKMNNNDEINLNDVVMEEERME
jgi:hypothetical protein